MTTILVAYVFIVGLNVFALGSLECWEPPTDTVYQELPDLIKQIGYIDLQSTITPVWQLSNKDKLGIVICLCTELPEDMSSYFFTATSDPVITPLHLYRMGYFHRFRTCEADLKEFAKNLALNEATTYARVLSSQPMSPPLVDLNSCISVDAYSWSSVLLHRETELLVEEKRRLQDDELYVIYNIDCGYQAVLVSPSTVSSGLLFVKFKGKPETVLQDARKRLVKYLISDEYIESRTLPIRPRWEIPVNIFLNQRDTIGGWLSSSGEVLNGWTFKHVLKLRIFTTENNTYQILLVLRTESRNVRIRMIGIVVRNDSVPLVTYNQDIKDDNNKYEDSLLDDYGQLAFSDPFRKEEWKFDQFECTLNYLEQIETNAPFPRLPSDKRIMFHKLYTSQSYYHPDSYFRICSCAEKIFLISYINIMAFPYVKFISPVGTAEEVERCYQNYNHCVETLFRSKYTKGLWELQEISKCIKRIQKTIHKALSAQHEAFKIRWPVIVKNVTSQPAWIEGPIYLAFPPFSETRKTQTDYWYCMVIKIPSKKNSVDVTAEGITESENLKETTDKTLDSGDFLFVTVSTKKTRGDGDYSAHSFEYIDTIIRSSGYSSLETAQQGMFSFVKNAHAE